jgi:hypothetical protein
MKLINIEIILFLLILDNAFSQYKYLGVERYGEIKRDEVLNKESEIYRFLYEDKEVKYKIYPGDIIVSQDDYNKYKCEDGAYPVQNKLKEGYEFSLKFYNDYIISAEQQTIIKNEYIPPVKNIPGLKTLKNFIATAFQPLGTTLYVFGGAWDFQDIGTSYEGRTIGISKGWVKFFDEQNSNYTYKDPDHKNETYYPFNGFNEYYYAGLDCSGFVGWTIYNTLNSESLAGIGYVMGASAQARFMSQLGYGTWIHKVDGWSDENPDYKLWANEIRVGDILSTSGHVMIVLSKCNDGSFIIIHSTPNYSKTGYPGGGVQMSAVNPNDDLSEDCEAFYLCQEYTQKFFKKWSERYNVKMVSLSTAFDFPDSSPNTGLLHWNIYKKISDPDNYSQKSAKEILRDLFNE